MRFSWFNWLVLIDNRRTQTDVSRDTLCKASESLSLCVASFLALFVYARLISQPRCSIPYRAWCWNLWSVRLLGRGTGALLMSLTLEYYSEQQRRGQEAYIIFSIVDWKAPILSPSIWPLNCQQNIILMPPRKRYASSAPKPPRPPKPLKAPYAWESYLQSFQATQYTHDNLLAVVIQPLEALAAT